MKYFVLIGKEQDSEEFIAIFGDYDKDVVTDEMQDLKESYADSYKKLKVITISSDLQIDIEKTLKNINGK